MFTRAQTTSSYVFSSSSNSPGASSIPASKLISGYQACKPQEILINTNITEIVANDNVLMVTVAVPPKLYGTLTDTF